MAKNSGIAQFSQGRSDVHRVAPGELTILDGWNTREENAELEAHIDMLAQSIAEVGVRKPIEVKFEDGKLIVKDGHCRTRAAMRAIEVYKADLKTVPVISVDRYANDADLIINQIISNSGKPLSSLEEAKVYKKLIDLGWKQNDIAKKVGKSAGRVSQLLGILTLPAPVLNAVAAGEISASLASSNFIDPATANAELAEALGKAKARGASKVAPQDLNASASSVSIRDIWENCQFDDENLEESGFATITFPKEEYAILRKYFKL